jgi:uncharacterized protein involved in tellurium resistance
MNVFILFPYALVYIYIYLFIYLLQFRTNGSMNVDKNSEDHVLLHLTQIKTDMRVCVIQW